MKPGDYPCNPRSGLHGECLLLSYSEEQSRVRAGVKGVTLLDGCGLGHDRIFENIFPVEEVSGALQSVGLPRHGAEDETYGCLGFALPGGQDPESGYECQGSCQGVLSREIDEARTHPEVIGSGKNAVVDPEV